MIKLGRGIILGLILTSCGASKSSEEAKLDEKARLDANEITLSPPPGEYTQGVVVTFKKKDESAGSGALEIKKNDGTWSLMSSECFGGVDSGSCLNISETTTIKYRLMTIAGESSEKTATYSINLQNKPEVIVNNTAIKHAHTKCAVGEKAGLKTLEAQIKIENTVFLGVGNVGYILLQVSDISKIGVPLQITDSTDTGFAIKGSGDTFIFPDFYPGGNSTASPSTTFCQATLDSYTPGVKAQGKIACNLSLSSYSSATSIGRSFVLPETPWSCDSWVSYL